MISCIYKNILSRFFVDIFDMYNRYIIIRWYILYSLIMYKFMNLNLCIKLEISLLMKLGYLLVRFEF